MRHAVRFGGNGIDDDDEDNDAADENEENAPPLGRQQVGGGGRSSSRWAAANAARKRTPKALDKRAALTGGVSPASSAALDELSQQSTTMVAEFSKAAVQYTEGAENRPDGAALVRYTIGVWYATEWRRGKVMLSLIHI